MLRKKKRGNLKPNKSSIVIDLRNVLATRNILQPYAFLSRIGINSNSANKLLKGEAVQVNMKQLTLLCFNLNCTPNDLFVLRDMELPELHALNRLAVYEPKADELSIKEWLAGKTVEEVRELMGK